MNLKGWKLGIILLSIVMAVAFATTAMAANVNISGAHSGSYTLNTLSIDSSGNIFLTVSGGGGGCTPTSASVLPTTIVRSITQGGTATAQTVNITDNCGTALGYTASVTSGGTWLSASSGTGSMAVTFTTAGLAAGSYTGTIQVTPTGYTAQTINVPLTVSGVIGGGGDCINIGNPYPNTLNNQYIPSQSAVTYCFTITVASASNITAYISSRDWYTNSDAFMSNTGPVSTSQISQIIGSQLLFNTSPNAAPWYNRGADSNERVYLYNYAARQGDKFYVTIYNNSTVDSAIMIYWMAY